MDRITTNLQISRSVKFLNPPREEERSERASGLKGLNRYLGRFIAKKGLERTNVLRLYFLPILKQLAGYSNAKYANMVCCSLTKWWVEILTLLKTDTKLTSCDRSVYLECLSKILARREWEIATDLAKVYQDLLTQTLAFAIQRLDSKKITLAASAFVGKVFAYSFFHLPNVSNALLFLLDVKIESLNKVTSCFKPGTAGPFPERLASLVNYTSRFDEKKLLRVETKFLNAVPPPKAPVRGIQDPKGVWVMRWSNMADSSDVFPAFLRHYLNLCCWYLKSSTAIPSILSVPGLTVLLSHVYQYLKKSSSVPQGYIKFCKVVRDLCLNPVDDYEANVHFTQTLVSGIDSVLCKLATEVAVSDTDRCCYILDLQSTFAKHVYDTKDAYFTQFINWAFWLKVLKRMTSSDNLTLELKSLSYLFNSWDMLVSEQQLFVDWTMSGWFKYFCHWQPLVRTYYHRLVIWRVLMCNTCVVEKMLKDTEFHVGKHSEKVKRLDCKPSSPIINRKVVISPVQNWDRTFVDEDLLKSHTTTTHPYDVFDEAVYTGSTSSTPQRSSSSTTLTSQSSQPSTNSGLNLNSVFKFFKKGKDVTPPTTPPQDDDSTFAKALSSLSLSSRSSSPSVMSSRNSPPSSYSSFEDLLTEEYDYDYDDVVLKQAEFKVLERTPEVYSHRFKFELVIDDRSIVSTIDLVNHLNDGNKCAEEPVEVPVGKMPDLPFLKEEFLEFGRKCEQTHELDMPKLNVLGKSLSEWNLCVDEFEQFITNRFDFPLLDVESPNKLNGY